MFNFLPWLPRVFPNFARACKLLMAWLVELRSPANKSAKVKDGVGLGFELGPTTPVSPTISTFSAKLASCCRLYSWMLVNPWIGTAPGGRGTGGGGGGIFWGLEVGGIMNEGSPSKEDCIDVGSEMGELVLIELGQPIEVVWTGICWFVVTPDTVEIGSGWFFTSVLSVWNFPNTSCNNFLHNVIYNWTKGMIIE